jgi:hypothetical protein
VAVLCWLAVGVLLSGLVQAWTYTTSFGPASSYLEFATGGVVFVAFLAGGRRLDSVTEVVAYSVGALTAAVTVWFGTGLVSAVILRDRGVSVVAVVTAEHEFFGGKGQSYHDYTLAGPDGRPIPGLLDPSVALPPGRPVTVIFDPRGDVAPLLPRDLRVTASTWETAVSSGIMTTSVAWIAVLAERRRRHCGRRISRRALRRALRRASSRRAGTGTAGPNRRDDAATAVPDHR